MINTQNQIKIKIIQKMKTPKLQFALILRALAACEYELLCTCILTLEVL